MNKPSQSLLGQCISEFLGTALIIFFGVGCVATLVLSGASLSQWDIGIIWGLGVAIAIYVSVGVSGAHLNPAVTLALMVFKNFDKKKVLPYIASQCLGAFTCALLIYFMYFQLFIEWELLNDVVRGSNESVATAGIFATFPLEPLTNLQALNVEIIITAILMLGILALTDDKNGVPKGMAGPLLIGLLVAIIAASMGGLTGFAMNPARDFAPRLFAYFAGWGDVAFTGGRDTMYFWVPIIGPIIGAQFGAALYCKAISPFLIKSTVIPILPQDDTNSVSELVSNET